MIRYKRKSPILTTSDIRRIQAEIAADIKLRESASERIAANKALLEQHDAAVEEQAQAPRKLVRKPIATKALLGVLGHISRTTTATASTIPHVAQKFERGGGSFSVVMDILQHAQTGLMAPEVRRQASAHPQASESLKNHPSYVYSILDQLKERKRVEKDADGKRRAI